MSVALCTLTLTLTMDSVPKLNRVLNMAPTNTTLQRALPALVSIIGHTQPRLTKVSENVVLPASRFFCCTYAGHSYVPST